MKHLFHPFALLTALTLSACVTGPVTIPHDISSEELIQRAHEASDRNRFGQALQFYQAMLELFPDDPALVVNAEYEIGFIHERRRNFDEARIRLEAVIARYGQPGADLLPEKYRVLAGIVLERIGDRRSAGRLARVHEPIITRPPEAPRIAVSRADDFGPALERAGDRISAGIKSGGVVAVFLMDGVRRDDSISAALEDFLQRRGFETVDAAELKAVLAGREFDFADGLDNETAATIGTLAGADVIVTGGIVWTVPAGQGLNTAGGPSYGEGKRELHLWALDTETANVLATAMEQL